MGVERLPVRALSAFQGVKMYLVVRGNKGGISRLVRLRCRCCRLVKEVRQRVGVRIGEEARRSGRCCLVWLHVGLARLKGEVRTVEAVRMQVARRTCVASRRGEGNSFAAGHR